MQSMAYIVMTYVVMAYIVTVYIVIIMAYVVMAHVEAQVVQHARDLRDPHDLGHISHRSMASYWAY